MLALHVPARQCDGLVAIACFDARAHERGRHRFVQAHQQFHRIIVLHACTALSKPSRGYSKLPTESCARLSKRVYSPKNLSLIEPVGPFRCLPMMISASPLSGELSLL